MAKPPPIRVGVEGIAPQKQEADAVQIDWERLIQLPSFQMFAAERIPNKSGKDSEAHASDVAQANGLTRALYDEYCQWHKDKGYWPNETPMGELLAHEGV